MEQWASVSPPSTFGNRSSQPDSRLPGCRTQGAPVADLFNQKVEGTAWKSKTSFGGDPERTCPVLVRQSTWPATAIFPFNTEAPGTFRCRQQGGCVFVQRLLEELEIRGHLGTI